MLFLVCLGVKAVAYPVLGKVSVTHQSTLGDGITPEVIRVGSVYTRVTREGMGNMQQVISADAMVGGGCTIVLITLKLQD